MIVSDPGNKMKYAVRKGGNAVAYCALSIRCGTRYEQGYSSGIAHFTEHTLFKGTKHKSARVINGYLDRLGGELNAFTTKEEIVLHATVLKEDLDKAADLLFELATCPTFPESEIEIEKGVVIDEINSYKDSPSEDIFDVFEQKFFGSHPLSSLILGTEESVNGITCEELRRFREEKFIPANMTFSIYADIDEAILEKKALKLIDKYFKDYPERSGVIPREKYEAAAFNITEDKDNHQVNCVIGAEGPSLYEETERITTVLLTNILGGPANNSLLNSELREKYGWVYGVECGYNQYSDTGLVTISFGCDKKNLGKCLRRIEKTLDRLQSEPLSERKLKEAKKQLLGQLAISSDNGEAQCLSMGKSLLSYGTVKASEEVRSIVNSISAEMLRDMAERIFRKTSRLIYL